MNKMKNLTDPAGATPRPDPPLNNELVRTESQQSESQPKHSPKSIIANLQKTLRRTLRVPAMLD
ncbi:hypothetical protein RDI58_011444 [Solanum bulbocastanum]|uniref:Uncharacterized protein n=1 Tax=Solanum bulbocastanum TaxID=147425 RepID=A0AAN8TPS4_SOLBU